jgi:hypothetical protein
VNTPLRTAISASVAIVIAACGGGGGGGSGGDPVQHAPSTKITSANAPVISGAVVRATSQSEMFGSFGGLTTPVFTSAGKVTISAIKSFQAKAGLVVAEATSTQTVACAVSGSVTFSADIASEDALSSGDRVNFDYQDCDEGGGAVLDGGFEFTVRTFQGDVANGSFLMTVDLVVTDFGMTQEGQSSTIDGDVSMTLDTRTANTVRVEVSGDALDVEANGEFASLADFSMAVTADASLGTSTLDADGYLMSSSFSGEVRYQTTQLLELNAAGVATAGEIRITGADGATVDISVLGENSAQLDIDLDGDGTIDEVVTVSWTELNG